MYYYSSNISVNGISVALVACPLYPTSADFLCDEVQIINKSVLEHFNDESVHIVFNKGQYLTIPYLNIVIAGPLEIMNIFVFERFHLENFEQLQKFRK